ncbi:hypothetical protein [Agromyces salentinus]|nr:hypothetical protein [Agromyces salentinus]
MNLTGRPRTALAVLALAFVCAAVATTGLATTASARDAEAERAARAVAIASQAGRVGIGAAAFDTSAARIAADIRGAENALVLARATAADATGKASAESLRALVASADELERDLAAARTGRWLFPLAHEVQLLGGEVVTSAAAWQLAEDARLAEETRLAEEARLAEDDAVLASDEQPSMPPHIVITLEPGSLIPDKPPSDPSVVDYQCEFEDGSGTYWSETPCGEEIFWW